MEVGGCGSFTHLQPDWSDLVTTLNEGDIKVLLTKRTREVDGGEGPLTTIGRTRDSRFRLIFNRSDLVNRHNNCVSEVELHHSETGRGSPPTFLEITTLTTSLRISMIEYITTNNRR